MFCSWWLNFIYGMNRGKRRKNRFCKAIELIYLFQLCSFWDTFLVTFSSKCHRVKSFEDYCCYWTCMTIIYSCCLIRSSFVASCNYLYGYIFDLEGKRQYIRYDALLNNMRKWKSLHFTVELIGFWFLKC